MELFTLDKPLWEMVMRGSVVYWFLFLLFRFFLRRDTRSMSVADLLFVVLVADAASNAMQGNYNTVGDGMVLVATLALWNYVMDWLAFRSPRIASFMEPAPEVLIRNGKPNYRMLARYMMSLQELQGKLRAQGVESIAEVRIARLESDGALSVFTRDGKPHRAHSDDDAGAPGA